MTTRARLTARRLERLADRLAPPPAEPKVFWIQVARPDPDAASTDAALAAMRAAVWDELAPLATRDELLALANLYDEAMGRVEAAGRWWDLALADGPDGPAVTIVGRGERTWLSRG
jgi:hypothetical protein